MNSRKATVLLCWISSLIALSANPSGAMDSRGKPPVRQDLQDHLQGAASNLNELLQSGRVAYQNHQFQEALRVWQQGLAAVSNQTLDRCIFLNNLALVYQQLDRIPDAQTSLQSCKTDLDRLATTPERDRILIQNLTNQGNLALWQGDADKALPLFEQVEHLLTQQPQGQERNGLWLQNQINQVQALQTRGLNRLAQSKMQTVRVALGATPASPLKAAGLRTWGDTMALVGDSKEAESVLKQSLTIAQSVRATEEAAQTLMSLGNLAGSRADNQTDFLDALNFYQQVQKTTQNTELNIQAELNYFRTLSKYNLRPRASEISKLTTSKVTSISNNIEAIDQVQKEIEARIKELPPGRLRVNGLLNLSQTLLDYSQPIPPKDKIVALLLEANREAEQLKDDRAQSYAIGTLGHLYEQNQRWAEAESLTNQAIVLALRQDSDDINYRWQWQLARILTAQGKMQGANAAYNAAIDTLGRLQRELVALNPDARFSFREGVEPLYREFVGFLLNNKDENGNIPQKNLERAQKVMESLQLAELVNFFRSNCVRTNPVDISKLDDRSAVIYPIVLPNSLEILVNIPHQGIRHYSINVRQGILTSAAKVLHDSLIKSENPRGWERRRNRGERAVSSEDPLSPVIDRPSESQAEPSNFKLSGPIAIAGRFYNWLIQPIEQDLKAAHIDTLVFVPDGPLRNIPFSVFYDAQDDQYLLEKYGIAITPGLQLLGSHPLADRSIQALVGGLSESVQGFAPLPSVKTEVTKISEEVKSSVLLNSNFQADSILKSLKENPYPVVHFATHGNFSSNAEDTYILTWNGRINVNGLSELLRSEETATGQPIELLILSACETAAGDDRAALGLAGVAVKAGARSTLATLWVVDDQGTSILMSKLYGLLAQRKVSKAEALRQAQLTLLNNENFSHPFYWAPFVLVGNWL